MIVDRRQPLGTKVRALRRRAQMSQVELARHLGISPSYLNMIEHDRRSLSARLLLELARVFSLDLQSFAADDDSHLLDDLTEVVGDPLLDRLDLGVSDVRELLQHHPTMGRALLTLYHALQGAREALESLAEQLAPVEDPSRMSHYRQPPEEVTDLIQRHGNYFEELEEGAAELWRGPLRARADLSTALMETLEQRHGIQVEIRKVGEMPGVLRRFDPERRLLSLSEVLRRGSRNFHLAFVLGLLTQSPVYDRLCDNPILTTDESRAMCRISVGNYFAAALLMPYALFLEAAETERYDIEVLGHRFRTSFEQICHRLTTLRKPDAEGIPFHMLRTDIAGNVSKRFSASGMRFARFSGGCPKWKVFSAFLTPGRFCLGLTRMPDGTAFFEVARTIEKESRGYAAKQPILAIGLGCETRYAKRMVYADGLDVDNLAAATPIGVTCRLCDRMDCEQRAFPPLQHPVKLDEKVRGVSFYSRMVAE
jgi:predicted transcriptional regulator/DNA-binding XRE family transcriptional regulator